LIPTIMAVLCLLASSSTPVSARSLIDQAYESGAITLETARLYRVYEAVNPVALPAQYRSSGDIAACGTPVVTEALSAIDESSEEYGRQLFKTLQRPIQRESVVSPSGHFRIHYELSGGDAVDPTDEDGNDIPDYIDHAAAALDSSWRLQVDQLGYRAPPSDGGAGGGDEYDVYVIEYGGAGSQYYGTTTALSPGATTTASFMQIDNNYTDAGYGTPSGCNGARGARGLGALRVTAAHEFYHAVHFAYYQPEPQEAWWQEATATWIEEVAYPEVNDYFIYLCAFLYKNTRSLDSGRASGRDNHIYGASAFLHFLDQRYGRDVIRQIWEEHAMWANAELSNVDRVLRKLTPGGLEDAVGEFGVWNYFTGHRHREQFYKEGNLWPEIPVGPPGTAVESAIVDSGSIDHLTSAYFRIEPDLRPGGVFIENELGPRTRWQRRIALVSRDTVEIVRSFEASDPAQVLDWDAYDEIVTVLTNTDFIGLGFDYEITADYDPQLTERDAPIALALKQNRPNPFRIGLDSVTWLPFELNTASFITRLSVLSLDGQLVRVIDLDRRSPGTYEDVSWDGRNQRGDFVGSGIYYYVLEADENRATKRLAVVRDQ
jgi:hypothetical protein